MIELLKVLLQLVGAFLIARFTVTWAFNRFKHEKYWEKKLSAYMEIISALTEIRGALDERIDNIGEDPGLSQQDEQRIDKRVDQAMIRLGEVNATAALILHGETEKTLKEFGEQLRRITDDFSGWESLNIERHNLVIETLDEINKQAREILGVSSVIAPDRFSDPRRWLHYRGPSGSARHKN